MSLVIDASVFVAAFRSLDVHHADSVAFLGELRGSRQPLFCPSIVLPESACAIVRLSNDPVLGERVNELITGLPEITLVPLSPGFARTAAELGGGVVGCEVPTLAMWLFPGSMGPRLSPGMAKCWIEEARWLRR